MLHKGCGGEIESDGTRRYAYPVDREVNGVTVTVTEFAPGYWCQKCGKEIGGDAEIVIEGMEGEDDETV